MQMNVIVTWAVFAVALTVALVGGIRWAYVAVYLPAAFLLNQLAPVLISHAPVSASTAPLYAILLAMPFTGESLRFRLCSVDVVAILLLVALAVTGFSDQFETGIMAVRNEALRLTAPYFIGRIVFQDWRMRRATLWVLVALTAFLTVIAVVEFRLRPHFYEQILNSLNLSNAGHEMATSRYGFFRVSANVEHPIAFGNTFLSVLGMIAVLARTSGVSLWNKWVAAGLAGATICVVVSLSYTPYLGLIAGLVVLATLRAVPWTRRLVLPLTILAIVALTAYTVKLATDPLDESNGAGGGGVGGSLYVRKLIVKRTWAVATTAGPFGYGVMTDFTGIEDFDLQSVDNSYMAITMTRGWVGVGLWIGLGVCFAARMSKAFRVSTDPAQVFPLAVGTATVLGIMVAMYTVWAGAFYTIPWFIMMALSNSLIDQVLTAADRAAAAPPAVGPLRPPVVRLGGRGLARA